MMGLQAGTLDWLVSIGSLACTKLPSLALTAIALIGLPLLALAAFYETGCAPISFGFPRPFTSPSEQPMVTFPFALMTLTLRGSTRSGTARRGAVSARR